MSAIHYIIIEKSVYFKSELISQFSSIRFKENFKPAVLNKEALLLRVNDDFSQKIAHYLDNQSLFSYRASSRSARLASHLILENRILYHLTQAHKKAFQDVIMGLPRSLSPAVQIIDANSYFSYTYTEYCRLISKLPDCLYFNGNVRVDNSFHAGKILLEDPKKFRSLRNLNFEFLHLELDFFERLFKKYPALEGLNVSESRAFIGEDFQKISSLGRLKTLNLSDTGLQLNELVFIFNHFKSLKTLDVSQCMALDDRGDIELDSQPQLTHLSFSFAMIEPKQIYQFVAQSPQLEIFEVAGLPMLPENGIRAFLRDFPAHATIGFINLCGYEIEPISIVALKKKCPSLRTVLLSAHPKIDMSFLPILNDMGVRVEFLL